MEGTGEKWKEERTKRKGEVEKREGERTRKKISILNKR